MIKVYYQKEVPGMHVFVESNHKKDKECDCVIAATNVLFITLMHTLHFLDQNKEMKYTEFEIDQGYFYLGCDPEQQKREDTMKIFKNVCGGLQYLAESCPQYIEFHEGAPDK